MCADQNKTEPKPAPNNGFPWMGWLLILALMGPVLIGVVLSWHSLSDFDIWLHHRVGQDILAGNGFPHTNTYSFLAADQVWLNHEWLFQTGISSIGPPLSVSPNPLQWNFLRTSLITIFLLVLVFGDISFRHLNLIVKKSWLPWLGLPLLLGIHVIWPRFILRPELFSYLAFVVLVRLLEKLSLNTNTKSLERKLLGSFFVVTLLWAQLHGFATIAPVMVLVAMIASISGPFIGFKAGKNSLRTMAMALGLSILALTLTPNGLAGIVYPFQALAQFNNAGPDMSGTISELVPLLETKGALGRTMMFFKISLVWGGVWILLNWGHLHLTRILLWLLATAAAIFMQRAVGLYAIAFIMLHTGFLHQGGKLRWVSRFKLPSGLAVASTGTALTLILAVFWGLQVINDDFYLKEGVSRRFGSQLTPALYPVKIAQSLGTADKNRVLANIDPAGYLLANTSVQLFIDGRTEAYAPIYWRQYNTLKLASNKSMKIIQDMKPDAIVLTLGSSAFLELAAALVDGSSWQLKAIDESALLFIPSGPKFKPGDNVGWLHSHIPALESAISAEPEPSPARTADRYLAVARLWKLAGESNSAFRCFKRGLDASPNHPTLNHNQGNLLMSNKDFSAALNHFQLALSVNGRLASSALNAGVCLMNLKQLQAAERMFQRGIRIDNSSFEGWANLGISFIQQGKNNDAKEALEHALALHPGDRNLRKMLKDLEN